MQELAALNLAVEEDAKLMQLWRDTPIEWKRSGGNFVRKRRLLRPKIVARIRERLEAGDRDAEKITEQVCESFIGMLILTEILKAFVFELVKWLIKRWTNA